MPRGAKRDGFVAQWRAELPRVAASLTTAFILFAVSLTFAPVREWLFRKEVKTYPISCAADPVAMPDGRRLVEFYIVNRSREDFTGETLQQRLNAALQGSGASARAEIVLPFDSEVGRIDEVSADAGFNADKGELDARVAAPGVRLAVRSIDAGAILRANIVIAGMPDAGPVSRDAKVLVPFKFEEIQEACYTRG